MNSPRPPIRGKYSIRNPAANFLFCCLDAVLSICTLGHRRPAAAARPPRRILISDIAHLGDVIMATSMLPVLKRAFPDCEIGFLVGTWALPVLQNHPLVTRVHVLDHWAHNRANMSKRVKLRRYLQTRRKALQEIKAAQYDVAFDFYWNFPNTLPLLWQTGIPVRIGYESGGFGPLATHALEFGGKRLHAAQRFLDLVRTLPEVEALLEAEAVPKNFLAALHPILPPVTAADEAEVDQLLAALDDASAAGQTGESRRKREYVVFHVGAADSFRDWPEARWRELARMLTAQGHQIVFTGTGSRDEARIQAILGSGAEELSDCLSVCGHLSWSGFVAAIAGARLLVCVDTVAGHLAAAVQTQCVVITAGRWPYLWRPLGPEVRVVMHPVPCAPCHRNQGCSDMECVRDVAVLSVYQESQRLLRSCIAVNGLTASKGETE